MGVALETCYQSINNDCCQMPENSRKESQSSQISEDRLQANCQVSTPYSRRNPIIFNRKNQNTTNQNTPNKILSLGEAGNLTHLTTLTFNGNEDFNSQMLSVPFDVIILQMDPYLKQQLFKEKLIQNKLGAYRHLASQKWKLHPLAYYFSQDTKKALFYTITRKLYYEGSYKEQDGMKVADGQGMLITAEGIYKGSFSKGIAQGNGCYITNSKMSYEGFWMNGLLKEGCITGADFVFNGVFEKGVPYGKGTFKSKSSNIFYKGNFVDGLFDDEKGIYECDQYIYQGGFVEGKKQGYGWLRDIKNKRKNRPKKQSFLREQLKGQWANDIFYS